MEFLECALHWDGSAFSGMVLTILFIQMRRSFEEGPYSSNYGASKLKQQKKETLGEERDN